MKADNRARLRAMIEKADLTQQATADLLGVHITTVQRWLADPGLESSRAVTKRDLMALELSLANKTPKTKRRGVATPTGE